MDDEQKPQEVSPQPQAPTIVNTVQPIQQPIGNPQAEQLSAPEKPRLIKSLLVPLVITFLAFLCIIILVLGDIQAGVLRGEPETGWGIAIGVLLFGPLLLIFGPISLIRVRRLKSQGQKIGRTVKMASLITVVLLVIYGIYSFGMSKYEDYAGRDRREQAQQQSELDKELNKKEAITVEYATELLNTCKLKGFYYGDRVSSGEIKALLSSSKDGVVLVKANGSPSNIQIADRAKVNLLPVAENAKKNCPQLLINEPQPLR